MKNLNILIISIIISATNVLACIPDCWAEKLGYPCCLEREPEVVKEDEYGQWGMEDGKLCGILVWDHNLRCAPSAPVYEECDVSLCNNVVNVDEDGTIWGYNPESKIRCIMNKNNSKCVNMIKSTCWSALLGYKCCKTNLYPLYKDKDGIWSVEDNKWCGIERCSDCSNIQDIDEYGNIWSVNKNSNFKCIISKHDENCSTQLEASCKFAKIGYMCCKNTDKVVLRDDSGSWGVENGKWCGFNNEL